MAAHTREAPVEVRSGQILNIFCEGNRIGRWVGYGVGEKNDFKVSDLSNGRIALPFIEKEKAAGGNIIGHNVKNFNLSTDVNVQNGRPL